ncbi:hypothetical protein DPEC_G00156500 [Dallia pectoralis]|uniref:Uncharacterized protein n=1 Tax=Dallia pectoralis TaxID=75939 RepID=A0ACC2GKQ0_DALPE|nr:hypothetical protein DPEC_G00156500 [Dallia pectoralis]
MEFRSGRNNVRILNVPEKMELDNTLTFVSSLLLEVQGPSGVLSSAPKLDRAHRLGRLPDDSTKARPRPLICCLHDFLDRERILRRRDKSQLFFCGGKIFIFPDLISSVSKKRATFLAVKRQLYDRKVRFSLRQSARLHVEHSRERLVFDSAGDALKCEELQNVEAAGGPCLDREFLSSLRHGGEESAAGRQEAEECLLGYQAATLRAIPPRPAPSCLPARTASS